MLMFLIMSFTVAAFKYLIIADLLDYRGGVCELK
jgi:hypothetical protein